MRLTARVRHSSTLMSIYATLWRLKFPRYGYGDVHTGCEWVEVTAQGVPPHIDSSTPGLGYEDGDPYTDFLLPAVITDEDGDAEFMRAVVVIKEETVKRTDADLVSGISIEL